MDPATKDLEYYLGHYWAFVLIGFVVHIAGVAVKNIWKIRVPEGTPREQQPVLFRLWEATLIAHPAVVGGLFGFVDDLPVPMFVLDHWAAHVGWFSLAGVFGDWLFQLATQLFQMAPQLVRMLIAKYTGLRASSPPPPPDQPEDPGALPPGDAP